MKRFVILCLALLLLTSILIFEAKEATADRSAVPNWELVLPDLPTRIWRSPSYTFSKRLYVTTDRDLRRTTDDGATWQTLYPRPPQSQAPGISSMTFDPATPFSPTLFLARNIPAGPAEIYHTPGSSLNWTTVFSTTETPIYDLTAVRNNANQLVVFAVGGPHVWRSADGGSSWETAESGLPEWADIYRVYPSPNFAADETLYLTGFGSLLRSTNGGDSWAVVSIPEVDVARHVVFSPQYAADKTLWVSYFFIEGHGEYDPNGVVRSADGGLTWETVNEGLPVEYLDDWIMGLAVSPDYPTDSTLYAVERTLQYNGTTWDLYRSPLAGDGWIDQNTIPGAMPNGLLAARRNLFFLPTQAGLWRLNTDCWQWLLNGDVERSEGWQMPATPATADYSTTQAHSGSRSIHMGITGSPNHLAYSSARQKVTIPADALSASADFWLYTVSTSAVTAFPLTDNVQSAAWGNLLPRPLDGDAQYVLVLDQNLNVLETLLWHLDNTAAWQQYIFDLSDYIGQTIWLHFGVYNDGSGGITAMYLDDASLTACEPSPPNFDQRVFLPSVFLALPEEGDVYDLENSTQ